MSEFGDGGADQSVPQQGGEDEQREEAASEHAAGRNLVQVPTVEDSCEVQEIHFLGERFISEVINLEAPSRPPWKKAA